ncbi:hypothetical protein SH528x_003740 [Novipirellula sp. SH528]|uniref:hypothetical protein n=1 Tax=Novipirellula sp. SH528 TaxID=3454466 RepID=UPI003F9F842E
MIDELIDCDVVIDPSSMDQQRNAIAPWVWGGITAFWFASVLAFAVWMTAYGLKVDSTNLADGLTQWPAISRLAHADNTPTLVLFLHPHCPCSWATVRELDKILDRNTASSDRRIKTLVVASVPGKNDNQWAASPLCKRAKEVSDAELIVDIDGRESDRFGVKTSGTVLLFDEKGELHFAGGITVSRGHEGDSVGGQLLSERLAALSIDSDGMIARDFAISPPVFGCKLCLPQSKDITNCSVKMSDGAAP